MKYAFSHGGWCTAPVGGTYGVSFWKHISNGWASFMNFVKYEIRIGDRIQFWHDCWWSEEHFSYWCLDLFQIARDKEAMPVDCMTEHGTQFLLEPHMIGNWNICIHFWKIYTPFSFANIRRIG